MQAIMAEKHGEEEKKELQLLFSWLSPFSHQACVQEDPCSSPWPILQSIWSGQNLTKYMEVAN